MVFLGACAEGPRRQALPNDTQVVAQWVLPPDATPLSIQRYFAAEGVIDRECRETCSETGNDIGSGTFNVFLYTADVDATVRLLAHLQDRGRLPEGMRIGVAEYTNPERTDWTYRPVYPEGLTSFDPFGRTKTKE